MAADGAAGKGERQLLGLAQGGAGPGGERPEMACNRVWPNTPGFHLLGRLVQGFTPFLLLSGEVSRLRLMFAAEGSSNLRGGSELSQKPKLGAGELPTR